MRKFRISESEHAKAFKRITTSIRDTFYVNVDLAFALKLSHRTLLSLLLENLAFVNINPRAYYS